MHAIVARSIICQIARANARNIACTSLAAHNISYNTTSNIHATLDIFVRYLCNKYTVGRGTTEISRPNPSIELGLELQMSLIN